MASADQCAGLYSLPNELLLHILAPFPTTSLLPLTTVSHRLHALILRILHNRLLLAANLRDHTLLLECYHPSAKLTEPPLYCRYLGTDGLDDVLETEDSSSYNGTIAEENNPVGRLGDMTNLYSRFRPHRRASDPSAPPRRARPGDVPGSRTHALATSREKQHAPSELGEEERVRQILSLDSHELFTQLCAVINLAKAGPRNGLFLSFVEVEDGILRVWRDWLGRTAGPDGGWSEAQVAIREEKVEGAEGSSRLNDEERILWIGTAQNVGIKLRIRERRFRRENAILVAVDEDVAVSYDIEYEELLVRTSHLLLMIERSLVQQQNHSGKAVVFGSFG